MEETCEFINDIYGIMNSLIRKRDRPYVIFNKRQYIIFMFLKRNKT